MRRGQLDNLPAPQVDVDWRVLFVDPTHGSRWREFAWRFVSRWAHLLPVWAIAPFLRVRRNAGSWLLRFGGRFEFEVVVIGPDSLARAVRWVVESNELWVRRTAGYADWHAYAEGARPNGHLVELVVPVGADLPLLQGVPVADYRGWGHDPGR